MNRRLRRAVRRGSLARFRWHYERHFARLFVSVAAAAWCVRCRKERP